MSMCRRLGAIRRMVPLLGVLLLFLATFGPVATAVAQGATAANSGMLDTTFPYFGPDPSKRMLLTTAYIFQMGLFKGISSGASGTGPSASGNALFYLGLAGTLVGALLIIFFPKYQKVSTVVPWFLVVIIVMFGPYGSNLFFYKLSSTASPLITKSGSTMKNDSKECTEDGARCGLTVQLAAIHIGSTLQLAFSDLFRSYQWKGIMDSVRSDSALTHAAGMDMGTPWLRDATDYAGQCSDVGLDKIISKDNIQMPAMGPLRLSQAMGKIGDYFAGTEPSRSPPKIILLPRTLSDVDKSAGNQDETNVWKWSDQDKAAYLKGLSALYNRFVPDAVKKGKVTVSWGGYGNTISVKDALDMIRKTTPEFFSIKGDGNLTLNPGFFITTESFVNQPTDNDKSFFSSVQITPATARGCYTPVKVTRGSLVATNAAERQKNLCINASISNNVVMAPAVQKAEAEKMFIWLRGQLPVGVDKTSFWGRLGEKFGIAGSGDSVLKNSSNAVWDKFFALYRDPSSGVSEMPVGMGYFSFPVEAKNAGADAPTMTAIYSPDCITLGRELYTRAVNTFDLSTGKLFANGLVKWLTEPGGGGIPVTRGGIDEKSIAGVSTKAEADEVSIKTQEGSVNTKSATSASYRTAVGLNDVLGRALGDAVDAEIRSQHPETNDASDSISADDARFVVATKFIQMASRITANRSQAVGDIDKNAMDDNTNTLTGLTPGLNTLAGQMITSVSKMLVRVKTYFVGPMGQSTITFVNILVDLCLAALITLTPFLLLIGLVMPGAAFGLLTIVVLVAFVLKFVPVTLILLNNLGWVIYTVIDTEGGLSKDGDTMKDYIVLGMAGLYTSLVGLTLYLVFKIGDPAALMGRISAVDGAAKQTADAGAKLLQRAAQIGAGLAVGTLVGGARGGYGWYKNKPKEGPSGQDGTTPENPNDPNGPNGTGPKAAVTEVKDGSLPGLGKQDDLADKSLSGLSEALGGMPGTAPVDETKSLGGLSEAVGGMPGTAPVDETSEQMQQGESTSQAMDAALEGEGLTSVARVEQAQREEDRKTAEMRASAIAEVTASVEQQKATQDVKVTGADADVFDNSSLRTTGMGDNSAPTPASAAETQQSQMPPATAAATAVAPGTPPSPGPAAGPLTPQQLQQQQMMGQQALQQQVGGQPTGVTMQQPMQQQQAGPQVGPAAGQAVVTPGVAATTMAAITAAPASENDVKKAEEEYVKALRERADQLRKDRTEEFGKVGKMEENAHAMYKEYTGLSAIDRGEASPEALRQRYLKESAFGSRPSLGSTVLSGMWGGFMANFQGASTIPFIGKAISEAWNEDVEAEARAMGWKYAKQKGRSWGDIKRDGDRNAMLGRYSNYAGASEEYQMMRSTGGYQAKLDNALQALTASVAQLRSSHQAMVTRAHDTGQKNVVMNLDQLKNLGLASAYDRLAKLRFEGMDQMMKMKYLDAAGKAQTKDIQVTHRILDRWATTGAEKGVKKFITDMRVDDYGVIEKQYLRKGTGWRNLGDMRTNDASARKFIVEDADVDYHYEGEKKMREGKIGWQATQQLAEEWSRLASQEEKHIREEVERQRGVFEAAYEKGIRDKTIKMPEGFTSKELQNEFKEAQLGSLAAKWMKENDFEKLVLSKLSEQSKLSSIAKQIKRSNAMLGKTYDEAAARMLKQKRKQNEFAEVVKEAGGFEDSEGS